MTSDNRPAQEPRGSISAPLEVDVDVLRALASTLSDQSAMVETIRSAARLTAAADALADTAVGASLARAAQPISGRHERFAHKLTVMSRTAEANAENFADTDAATGSALDEGGTP